VLDVALGALLVVSVAATFAPWLRSGEARRSSYEVVRTADRLDLLGPSAERVGRIVWATLPLAAAVGLLALVRERRMLAGAAGAWVALAVGSLALALTRVPEVADDGVAIAAMAAAGLALVAGATLIDGWRTR
jgi:hypothetical protein